MSSEQNRHQPGDLKQMQSLPLEAKIRLTKERIQAWYESWSRFDIVDTKTGKRRSVTIDTRDPYAEPKLKETEWIENVFPGQVYVSFSGGKDSTVLKHIVDSMYDDVPSLFVNTGLEYPEIQKFAMSQKNVITVRPEMRFDEVIKVYGYPIVSKEISNCVYWGRKGSSSRIKRLKGEHKAPDGSPSMFNCEKWGFLLESPFSIGSDCCNIMKKKPAKHFEKQTGRKPFIGMLAEESLRRRIAWFKTGCNAFEKDRPQSQPLAFWTEQDILHYIKKYNVPYCEVYGEIVTKQKDDQISVVDVMQDFLPEDELMTTGCNRTGCIFCGFGCHLEKEPNKFQMLKQTHPKQWNYCINGGEYVDGMWQPSKEGLGMGKVLDYIGVKYE